MLAVTTVHQAKQGRARDKPSSRGGGRLSWDAKRPDQRARSVRWKHAHAGRLVGKHR
jgi:hypothetical protein